MTCKACNGTGLFVTAYWHADCEMCIGDSRCPQCDHDNIAETYTDEDDFEWAWDGTTPCANCGWQLEQEPQQ